MTQTIEAQAKARNPLGYESIKKLLFSLAIPSIIANLVSAFYNVVDQIFIGQKLGTLGNAATNIAFPITIICLSIGIMTGIGGAAGYNLMLGEKKKEEARKIVGTAYSSMVLLGIVLLVAIRFFLAPLLHIFGSTEAIYAYAYEYTAITTLGIPFFIFTIGANPIVRADGGALFSMLAIVFGAVVNTLLDPLFIFVLDMGIAGAAWATVIGQVSSALIFLFYIPRFRYVRLAWKDGIPHWNGLKKIMNIGMASFIFQITNILIVVTLNNILGYYGAVSVYGKEIPIAVAGIVAKVNTIFFSVLFGLVAGAGPIFSFNYGAMQYKRVRKGLHLLLRYVFIMSVFFFLLFELGTQPILSIFGKEDSHYYQFAVPYMRIALSMICLTGLSASISTFFPAIGHAKLGTCLAVIKQILFVFPLLLLFPSLWGVEAVSYALATAELFSFLVALLFLRKHLKEMPQEDVVHEEAKRQTEHRGLSTEEQREIYVLEDQIIAEEKSF